MGAALIASLVNEALGTAPKEWERNPDEKARSRRRHWRRLCLWPTPRPRIIVRGRRRAHSRRSHRRRCRISALFRRRSANGVPALKDAPSKISGNMPAIVAQLQTIQWYANQPMPGSTSTPPALLDPYAAQCIPPLINFIETTPNPAALPSPPTGSATGPLVDLEVVRLKAILIDEFVNAIGQRGFPPALQLGCAAYVQNAKNLPFKLGRLAGELHPASQRRRQCGSLNPDEHENLPIWPNSSEPRAPAPDDVRLPRADIPTPPRVEHWSHGAQYAALKDVYGNDRLGDCTAAGAGAYPRGVVRQRAQRRSAPTVDRGHRLLLGHDRLQSRPIPRPIRAATK